MLTLGMIVAGHFTDIVGPRWIWGAASIAAGLAGLVGLALARAAAGRPGLPERRPLPAATVEPTQRV
jgi:hypothetical protein